MITKYFQMFRPTVHSNFLLLTRYVRVLPSIGVSRIRNKGFMANVMEKVRKEAEKDEGLSSSLKTLESLTDIKKNKTIQAMKDTISKAKKDIVEQNGAVFSEIQKKAEKIQENIDSIADTISTVTEPVKKLGRKFKKSGSISKAIGESKISRQVQKQLKRAQETIVDDTESFRYGGFMSKEQRKELRKEKLSQSTPITLIQENPEAGSNIVVHKDSEWRQKWIDFKDNNPIFRKMFDMKRAYDESNNIFVYFARSITNSVTDTISSIFKENETAKAIKEIRNIDHTFQIESFMKQSQEYIIPEILEAFLKADLPILKPWCGEATFNVMKAYVDNIQKSGMICDGKVLDLRNVELVTAKILEDRPILIISFTTQQLNYVKEPSTGKIIEGSDDQVDFIFHVWALAKQPEYDSISGGWKLIEMSMRPANNW